MGTSLLLERWGADDDVCKAGLFHSIYGTEFFTNAVLPFSDRPRVIEQIGERAERLAYIFCVFDRRSVYSAIAKGEPYSVVLLAAEGRQGWVAITKQELMDLVFILWANAVEQVPSIRFAPEARSRSLASLEKCRSFLPGLAIEELQAVYGDSARAERA